MKKTYRIAIMLVAAALLVTWACYLNRPWSEEDVERAKVDVQQQVCFTLVADDQEVAYFSSFSPQDSAFVGLTLQRDSALLSSEGSAVWVNSTALFPSAFGLLLAVDECANMETELPFINSQLRPLLIRNRQRLLCERQRTAGIADEVDYYLHRHSIADNEYIGVANFSYMLASQQRYLDRMTALLDSLLAHSQHLEVKVERHYRKDSLTLQPVTNILKKPSLLRMHSDYPNVRFVVLGSDSLTSMPDSCKAFSTPLFLATDFSDRIDEWHKKFRGITYTSLLTDDGLLRSLELYRYIVRDTLYVGEAIDTLSNTYRGQMTEDGLPKGYGIMWYADGHYYEGEWQDGKRHGHGFEVANGQLIRAGEWGDDKYLGEKMTYTDNRVYGIDISRYQHETGHQVYPINWNAMRITSLGSRNSRQVEGDIDFPVSFVYIKSTQGVTIRSAYYQQDSRDARSHGIHCGAYHFFSFKSTGKEQARYFLENTEILAGDMPPVLDVEPTDEQIEEVGGEAHLFDDMRAWLTTVERAVGKRPIIYVSQNFIKYHLVHAPDLCQNYQVWIARYNVYRPDVRLLFWQLCYDGRVAGIHGGVDVNIFNGYREQYDEFLESLQSR